MIKGHLKEKNKWKILMFLAKEIVFCHLCQSMFKCTVELEKKWKVGE